MGYKKSRACCAQQNQRKVVNMKISFFCRTSLIAGALPLRVPSLAWSETPAKKAGNDLERKGNAEEKAANAEKARGKQLEKAGEAVEKAGDKEDNAAKEA